jgi:hypothetical protein
MADHFIRSALAPSTRAAYDVAARRYTAYWAARNNNPNQKMDYYHVSEWLSSLALDADLKSATIRQYSSALSTAWVERLLPIAPHPSEPLSPNPLEDPRMRRVLDGITRTASAAEGALRAAARRTDGLTSGMIQTLTDLVDDHLEHRFTMILAAAALGWAAALRPSELLGSRQYPDRTLRRDQLVFYQDQLSFSVMTPRYTIDSSGTRVPNTSTLAFLPDHAVLRLDVSKTDQKRKGRVAYIAQPLALGALWRWATTSLLLDYSDTSPRLFQLPDERPLTIPELLADLSTHLAATHPDLHLTGKTFRSGAASTLVAQGVPDSDIASVGWTPTSKMFNRYASGASLAVRAIETNRRMA